jgi:hypothetical protein
MPLKLEQAALITHALITHTHTCAHLLQQPACLQRSSISDMPALHHKLPVQELPPPSPPSLGPVAPRTFQVEHMVCWAQEGELESGTRQCARVWRPVAVQATPQAGQDEGAVEHSRKGKGCAQLQAAAAGAGQAGRLGVAGVVCVWGGGAGGVQGGGAGGAHCTAGIYGSWHDTLATAR